ncbi:MULTISPECIES: hypothetical protein [Bradyrhizobium]|uniref:hypothetical protein n=1 Tax=Bradyrhizobium TaxID=374 RepID=UPI001CD4ACC0|nr:MULTISPECIES: hypothetical protein [Bradyrhizobium]MCA1529378.1 hypothetical protein [Bradyrhizobium yuanmingense]MCA1550141.1 hypothetical protein [Bradyrhizobium sp. BRP19]
MSEGQGRISIAEYVSGMSAFLRRSVQKRLSAIALGTVAVMFTVFLVSQMIPASYTATASVRLARVDDEDLLTPQATATQMNLRAFQVRALDAAGLVTGPDDRGRKLILDSFNARPNTAGTLTLVVTAADEKQAGDALEAAVRQLNKEQEKLRAPLVSDIEALLALADANIASLTRIRESLATSDSITPSAAGDPLALAWRRVWLLDLTTKNERSLFAANAQRRRLVSRLGPANTYPASLSDDVVVVQASPRPVRHAIFAGAIALLALLLYAMIRMPGSTRAD